MSKPNHNLSKAQIFEVIDEYLDVLGEGVKDTTSYDFLTEILLKFSADNLASALEETVRIWDLDMELSPNYGLNEDDLDYDPEIGDYFDYIEYITGVKAR